MANLSAQGQTPLQTIKPCSIELYDTLRDLSFIRQLLPYLTPFFLSHHLSIRNFLIHLRNAPLQYCLLFSKKTLPQTGNTCICFSDYKSKRHSLWGGGREGKEMRNVHGVVNFEHITKSDIQKYSIPYFLRLTHCSSTVLIPQMEGERGV